MSVTYPAEETHSAFEQHLLHAWHEAHGRDGGRISTSWGADRVVAMIENAFFKGERLLTQSEQGNHVLEQYVRELLAHVIATHEEELSVLLDRRIVSTSYSVNTREGWVMFIFWLAE
ncbi:MAG: Na-translocating system protein MpsC family protein [Candidatus Promineifilaceae bacterium]|nr:Na-translocating system protein MpsC family protein [Candidatus Promineifilaceae bacterium]